MYILYKDAPDDIKKKLKADFDLWVKKGMNPDKIVVNSFANGELYLSADIYDAYED